MQSSTTVQLLNVLSLATSVPLLCVIFSIFDFIVTNRMYYTIPDQRVLLEPDLFWWFIGATTLVVTLSMIAIFCEYLPPSFRQICLRYPILFTLAHCALLSFCCVLCAFCTYLSALSGNGIARYAYNATPEQFRMASHWYLIRLRVAMVLFGVEAVLSLGVLSSLYLGIQCRYRSLAQFPQPQKSQATQLFL